MFCDHSQLRRRHKTAGHDVFLSTAGTPNPPGQAPPDPPGTTVPLSLNPTPLAMFLPRLAACSTPHGRTVNCTRSPLSREFCAGNPHLVTTSVRNYPPFTSVHSHADAQKSSGAFSGLWPGKVLEMANSLQSDAEGLSEGARDVMVIRIS
jgi:hypothetical protein